jgi:hypothetical protein
MIRRERRWSRELVIQHEKIVSSEVYNARGSRQQWLLQYLSSGQVFTSLIKQFYVKGNKDAERRRDYGSHDHTHLTALPSPPTQPEYWLGN